MLWFRGTAWVRRGIPKSLGKESGVVGEERGVGGFTEVEDSFVRETLSQRRTFEAVLNWFVEKA